MNAPRKLTYDDLILAVIQYGPTIIPLLQSLWTNVRAGRGQQEVTEADWATLKLLSEQTSADVYARLRIAPPPAEGALPTESREGA